MPSLMFLIYPKRKKGLVANPAELFLRELPKILAGASSFALLPGEGVSPSPAGERTCGTASGSLPLRLGRAAAGEVIFNQGKVMKP